MMNYHETISKLYEIAESLKGIVETIDPEFETWEQEATGIHTLATIADMVDYLEEAGERIEKAGDMLDLIENKMWRLIK